MRNKPGSEKIQLRETLPGVFYNQMRETPTFAHLSSVFKSDRRPLSILRLFRNRQKARKMGLLGPSDADLHMKIGLSFTPLLCKNSEMDCNFTPG